MRLGLDFDNTLVSYDGLFRRVALRKAWVPASLPPHKNAVRDHLRAAGREDDWTRLQGEVYGACILEAQPHDGLMPALRRLAAHEVPMCIVSHKTRLPYLGGSWDLHAAARGWLEQQGFHDAGGLGWPRDRVFFEASRQDKIARIVSEGCTHYVDDLPEILDLLPAHIEKIHFAPNLAAGAHAGWRLMRAWHELPALLGMP